MSAAEYFSIDAGSSGVLKLGMNTIHNRIRKLRFDADEMTQQELADRIGVTRQTVVAIEGAKYSPSLEIAFRIAEVFAVPLDQVFRYGQESFTG
jgi:putative transcriptional regulator